MKNKTIDIILTLLVVVTLCSYFIIRNQIYNESAFKKQLEYTKQYIKAEKWDEAMQSNHSLKDRWKHVRFAAMLNYGEADIGALEEHINMLIGGTESRDAATALSSSIHIEDLWDNMSKLVPRP